MFKSQIALNNSKEIKRLNREIQDLKLYLSNLDEKISQRISYGCSVGNTFTSLFECLNLELVKTPAKITIQKRKRGNK